MKREFADDQDAGSAIQITTIDDDNLISIYSSSKTTSSFVTIAVTPAKAREIAERLLFLANDMDGE